MHTSIQYPLPLDLRRSLSENTQNPYAPSVMAVQWNSGFLDALFHEDMTDDPHSVPYREGWRSSKEAIAKHFGGS